MMKKKMKQALFALCFGIMTGLCGTHMTAQAEEVKSDYIEVDTNQSGAFYDAYIPAVGEEEVLTGAETWADTLKNRITYGMSTFQKEVNIEDLGITYNNANLQTIVEIYQQVIDENPSLFYANNGLGWSWWDGRNVFISIQLYYDEYEDANGNIDMNKINAYKYALNKAMEVVKSEMTDVEKALALHDYLVLNCEYDHVRLHDGTIPNTSYTSYGALVDRIAVCQGYAYAYAEMLRTAGIPTYVVASDEMRHAWNLVYLDGAWYHIDVTYDDPVDSFQGECMGVDYNDEGFVWHDYFVKSDAEFLELEHHDWAQEFTDNTLPVASQSGSYADYIFRTDDYGDGEVAWYTAFTYYNGYWYYMTLTDNYGIETGDSYISRSKIRGEEKATFSELGAVNYVQMQDGRLYFADYRGAYTTALSANMQRERIWTAVGSKTFLNCEVTEFVLYSNNIIAMELYDEQLKDYVRLLFDINTRELTPMPKLTILTMPNVNYQFTPYAPVHLDGGKFGIKYSDGTLYPVSELFALNSDHANMTEEGVYEVEVSWRGLTTKYDISLKHDFPITDVLASPENWKYEGIKYVYDKEYMSGVDADSFAPDQTLTRGMVVQILYNMEKVTTDFAPQFSDVTEDKWYASAVTWAYQNNIASGYEDGRFGAEDAITREQVAVMLKGYAELKQLDTNQSADLSGFTDAGLVHEWAEEALSWANYNEIINGKLGGILDPRGYTTRAEMAAIITNYCNKFVE